MFQQIPPGDLPARHRKILQLITRDLPNGNAMERARHIRRQLAKLYLEDDLPHAPNDQLIGWYYAACVERLGQKDECVLSLVIWGHLEDTPSDVLDCIRKNGLVDSNGDVLPGAEDDVREWVLRFANTRDQLFVA